MEDMLHNQSARQNLPPVTVPSKWPGSFHLAAHLTAETNGDLGKIKWLQLVPSYFVHPVNNKQVSRSQEDDTTQF